MPETDSTEAALNARFASGRSPLLDLLGITFRVTPAGVTTHCRIADRHTRGLNIAHGGVLCTLLDTSLGATAYAAALPRLQAESEDRGERRELVTLQLETHFIRPAWNGESLVGTGEVLHQGRTTIVARGEVRTESGNLVVSGAATFMPTTVPSVAS